MFRVCFLLETIGFRVYFFFFWGGGRCLGVSGLFSFRNYRV